MTTLPAPKARRRPDPSPRDQEIYLEYSVHGKTQVELAKQHDLTQCRISQIVRRVAHWRANLSPPLPLAQSPPHSALTTLQQQRLDRWLERQRLETVCREAMRSFHKEQRTVKTTKKGRRGEKAFDETIRRELPANVQYLKVVIQANRDLGKLEDKEPLPQQELSTDQRWRIMHDEAKRLRQQAEQAGRVLPSGNDTWEVVDRLIDALCGEPYEGGDKNLDHVMRQLSRTLLPECDRLPIVGTLRVPSASEDATPAEPLPTPTSTTCAPPEDSTQPLTDPNLAPIVANQKSSSISPSDPSHPSNFSHLSNPSSPHETLSNPSLLNPEPRTLNPPPPPDSNYEVWQKECALLRERIRQRFRQKTHAHAAPAPRHEASDDVPPPYVVKIQTVNPPLIPHINNFGYQPIPPPNP